MPSTSRPVKLACLACRASKIRCNGQHPCANCSTHHQVCRYRPSRRGGARRGAAAAEGLALKRAERLINESNTGIYVDVSDAEIEGYHHHSQIDASGPGPLLSPSPVESRPRRFGRVLENSSIGFPSPLSGSGITDAGLLGTGDRPAWSLRAYRCDQDLINAYYVFIHPYFPLLPPPAVPQYGDQSVTLNIEASHANASLLPFWPSSSLGLALAAILALIPPPGDVHGADDGAVTLRRSYADLYARSALESSEDSLESSSEMDLAKGPRSTLHPDIPRKMEPVLALGLLSLYECCQRGNVAKMRVRANQALTVAMDLSLHTQQSPTDCFDARRRCWWGTIFLVYQSSIMTASPPIITCDDLRITTPFPEFRGCREPWPLLMNAQVVLLRSCSIGRQLIREDNNNPRFPSSLGDEIKHLDSSILELTAEADRYRCVANCQGTEADAERNLWAISNALLHIARLTLHRIRAFPDPPIFFSEQCDLLANNTIRASSHHVQLSPGRIGEINSLFPFTEQESIRICLQSSLVVSRVFRRLPSPNPTYSDAADGENTAWASRRSLGSPRSMPYVACGQLQCFYALAMVLWRVRAAAYAGNLGSVYYLLDRPSVQTEVQDAERLMEELHSGMEALGASFRADSIFEGVEMMAKEMEAVYEATMMD
ncbi:Zn(II)2Cys6 transcription factor [Aspergillus sclerotiicarbonarius CBS 121057]|uniref:Zn(II)2Cys6 transcription factor n=1 Tax=Aspergillus sclerotiicarbonarius (strain CBS 121057 / IBT 28362) TaxID=1448318 RepID=A0A319FK40_ASPSB|nr:Zn(II)2Cys6 transcription factor [Aspergillus sclerotiicarbonarius CBS 121057]